MMDLTITKLSDVHKAPMELLLLADPSEKTIEEYIQQGLVYIASVEGNVIGVYVLLKIASDVIELKNIAVKIRYQGKGIGKKLVLDAIKKAKGMGAKKIVVGTGNSSLPQLALYQKCGFEITGIDKGYFERNYSEEIIENGIKCVDMIKLSIQLS